MYNELRRIIKHVQQENEAKNSWENGKHIFGVNIMQDGTTGTFYAKAHVQWPRICRMLNNSRNVQFKIKYTMSGDINSYDSTVFVYVYENINNEPYLVWLSLFNRLELLRALGDVEPSVACQMVRWQMPTLEGATADHLELLNNAQLFEVCLKLKVWGEGVHYGLL